MGIGGALGTLIERRKTNDRPWQKTKTPKEKTVNKWRHSAKGKAYLDAILAGGEVPLLKGDLVQLNALAEQDMRMDSLRGVAGK